MFVHFLGTAAGIILGGAVFIAGWCLLEGPGHRGRARRPLYHRCRMGHNHQTPGALDSCNRANRDVWKALR